MVTANEFPKLQTVKNLVSTLSKEDRFRTGFHSQHVKASKIHAKSPSERFHQVFLSLLRKLIRKMPALVLREILWVFLNTLAVDR